MSQLDYIKEIRKIELKTKKILSSNLSGAYHSSFKGQGIDFEELREYTYGDDPRCINWQVSARMHKPFIKKYKEDRQITLFLLIDLSASLNFGSLNSKRQISAQIASLLAFAAIQNNDKVGLLLFTENIEKFIPPRSGKDHVLRIIREILLFKPKSLKTDIDNVLEYTQSVLKRQAIVFLISDFISPKLPKFSHCSRKHDWISIILSDPHEINFPKLQYLELQDAESQELLMVNTSCPLFQKSYQELQDTHRKNLKKSLLANKIDFIEIDTNSDYALPLQKFFDKRNRRKMH